MRVETIQLDLRIRVAAIFHKGVVKPVWFEIKGKRVAVQEICYSWSSKEGAATILNYAVWDGKETFELAYDVTAGGWSLRGKKITV